MARGGSGLSSHEQITQNHHPTLSDRLQFHFDNNINNIHPNNKYYHHRPKLEQPPPMEPSAHDSESNGSQLLATIQFPVNLSCNNNDEVEVQEPSDNCKRTVIDEMDFFASSGKEQEQGHGHQSTAATSDDNKDPVNDVNTGLHLLTANTGSDQSMVDDGISPNSEDKRSKKSPELANLQAELERINRENQQLRDRLSQVTNNYNALQLHLITMMQQQQEQQQQQKVLHDDCKSEYNNSEDQENNNNEDEESNLKHSTSLGGRGGGGTSVPRQFIDLGLACKEPIALLDSSGARTLCRRSRSPPQEINDNHEMEGWGPNKAPRLGDSNYPKSSSSNNVDQAAEATMRKARVSVRARSEAPMISDGCQWRKYGQKMAKGNPCPRAYYRCTMAGGCPVRKQVQRCAEDRTILITTYEGTHSHPLPPAAMMMASATSSAARMLLSGSMPSADGTGLINPSNFLAYSRSLFPCSSSSVATISASAPFPTVTLDLTQSPNTNNNNPLQQLFQRPNQFPMVPFPGPPGLPAQLFGQPLYNQSRFSGLQVSGEESSGSHNNHGNSSNQLADTVTALTADPNFTAALAAAITSLMGTNNAAATNQSNNNLVVAATSDSNGNNTNTSQDNNSNGN